MPTLLTRHFRPPRRSTTLLLALFLAAGAQTRSAYAGPMVAASLLARPSDTTDGSHASMSDDGRYVVFDSSYAHQSIGQVDTNDDTDVFLFDRLEATVVLVSHRLGQSRIAGNGASEKPTISRDGAFVAFASSATDLVVGTDTNEASDVFLYDVEHGTLTLVSHAAGAPSTSADGKSFAAVLSGDGGVVVFHSLASNLVPGFVDGNGAADADVFHADLSTGGINLVSHAQSSSTTGGNGSSVSPVPSAGPAPSFDGSVVAFSSEASDLVVGSDGNGASDAFLFSVGSGQVTLLSHVPGSATTAGHGQSVVYGLSDDGAWAVMESYADDLTTGFDLTLTSDIFLYSRSSGEVTVVSHSYNDPKDAANKPSGFPVISGDGGKVAFLSRATNLVSGVSDADNYHDVFLFDRASGEVSLVSHVFGNPSVAVNGSSNSVGISRLGGLVAYASSGSNLVAEDDPHGITDVFRYSTSDQQNRLVTRAAGPGGGSANNDSRVVQTSADGELILLRSEASNLVAGLSTDQDGALYLYDMVAGTAEPVSVVDPGFPVRVAAQQSFLGGLSGDGRYLLYSSASPDLVRGQIDSNGPLADIFLFDRVSGTTSLVSHVPGQPLVTGNGLSRYPVIARDGRAVVFANNAPELVAASGATAKSYVPFNIFHYSLDTGEVTWVSDVPGVTTDAVEATISCDGGSVAFVRQGLRHFTVATGEMILIDPSGRLPSLSADGRHVVFQTRASLVPEDNNSSDDIYHYAVETGTVELLSRTPGGQAGNGTSKYPAISANGEFAVFQSIASDLVADDTYATSDVFHVALASRDLTLVSHRPAAPSSATGDSYTASMTDDGQSVVFLSSSHELVDGFVSDGGVRHSNLFHFDLASGVVTLVSHAFDNALAEADDSSSWPAVSADGMTIAFLSRASNLLSGYVDGLDPIYVGQNPDVFRFDLESGAVELISHSLEDPLRGGDGPSTTLSMSADGSTVAFESRADDLVEGEDDFLSSSPDVFLHGASAAADLVLSANDVQDPVPVDASMVYTFDVANDGPGTAPLLRVHLGLPAGALFQDASGADWTCTVLHRGLRCDGSPLAAQDVASTLTVEILPPPQGGNVTVTAGVGAATFDPQPGDNTVTITTLVTGGDTIFTDGFESGDVTAW